MNLLRGTAAFLCLSATLATAQLPHLPDLGSNRRSDPPSGQRDTNTSDGQLGSNMTDGQLGSGIKEILAVGTEKAVRQVSAPGGYLENAEIKILLPPRLQPVEKLARRAGAGPKIDDFVASMNHAAEAAAPEAGHIFADVIRSLTIDDARRLLNGGDTSVTDFFRAKTSDRLAAAFRPHVEAAMQANGVTQRFEEMQGSLPHLPFGGGDNGQGFDLNTYVVNGALNGLFHVLAEKEKEFRTNPAARTTTLLRQLFTH